MEEPNYAGRAPVLRPADSAVRAERLSLEAGGLGMLFGVATVNLARIFSKEKGPGKRRDEPGARRIRNDPRGMG